MFSRWNQGGAARWMGFWLLVLLVTGCLWKSGPSSQPLVTSPFHPRRVEAGGIENLYQVGPRLWSGGEPAGEAAFEELARLGVRIVVSVDGARPDVAGAARHGLRYVHVPIGYDGVSEGALLQMAVVEGLKGGVFVHCHHGRHRGPTAAAIMALCTGAWHTGQATDWQETAGTSKDYPGLYRAVQEFQAPDREAVRAARGRLTAVSPPAGLVAVMVGVDHETEVLEGMKAAGWKPVPGNPDVTPVGSARLLREQFVESLRLGMGPKSTGFSGALQAARDHIEAFERALRTGDEGRATQAWRQVREDCRTCHREWRDGRGAGSPGH